MDQTGTLLYANPCFTYKTGKKTSRTLVGKPFAAMALPEDTTLIEQSLHKLRQSPEKTIPVCVRTPSLEGGILSVQWELNAVLSPDQELAGIQCVGHDIPLLDMRQQTTLSGSPEPTLHEKLLNGLLGSRPDAALIVDSEHRILVMNDLAKQKISLISGRALTIGFSLNSVLESPVKEIYENLMYHVQVNGSFSKDLNLPSGTDGQPIWVHVRAWPIPEQPGLAGCTLITLEQTTAASQTPPMAFPTEVAQTPEIPHLSTDLRKPVTEILGLIAALNTVEPGDLMNATLLRRLEACANELDKALSANS